MREHRVKNGGAWPPHPAALFGPFIDIDPFDPGAVGPNSYDVRLAPKLRCYDMRSRIEVGLDGVSRSVNYLDMKKDNPTVDLEIPESGIVLTPGWLYLGTTVERTQCAGVVPWLDGRSSVGRLGISVHVTAGRGDDGFGMDRPGGCSWTLEITAAHSIRVYPNVRIGQLTFVRLEGDRRPYKGKYGHQDGPTASQMWRDFEPEPLSFDDGVSKPPGESS